MLPSNLLALKDPAKIRAQIKAAGNDKVQLRKAIAQIKNLVKLGYPDKEIADLLNFSQTDTKVPLIYQLVKAYLQSNFFANFSKIKIENCNWDEQLDLIKDIMSYKDAKGEPLAEINGADQHGNTIAKLIVNYFSVYKFARKIKYKDEKTLQLDETYAELLKNTMKLLGALGINYTEIYFGLLAETVPFSYYTADFDEAKQKNLALFLKPQNYSREFEDALTFANLKGFLEGERSIISKLAELSLTEEHLPPLCAAISTVMKEKYPPGPLKPNLTITKHIAELNNEKLEIPEEISDQDLDILVSQTTKLNPSFLWNELKRNTNVKGNEERIKQIEAIIFCKDESRRKEEFKTLLAIPANRVLLSCVTVLKYLMYLLDGFDRTELLKLIKAYNFNELIEAIYRGEKHIVGRIAKKEIVDLNYSFECSGKILENAMERDGEREIVDLNNNNYYQETKPSKLREFLKLFSETNYFEIGKKSTTALFYAVYLGRRDIVEVLKNAGAGLEPENEYGFTPLHLAAFKGDTLMTDYLIKLGADPKKADRDGRTILHFAAEGSSAEVIRKFSEATREERNKLYINVQDKLGQTPLHIGCKKDVTMVKVILKAGANVKISDKNGHLPQHVAAMHKNIEVVETIAGYSFLFSYMDSKGTRYAKRDFYLDLRDNEGKNVLHHLAISNISIIPGTFGSNINRIIFGSFGLINTGIITEDLAEENLVKGMIDIMKVLQEVIIDLLPQAFREAANASDNAGNTPLHYAAEIGNNETIKTLIKVIVIDPSPKTLLNKDGRNPADLARLSGHEDTVAILEKAGIKSSLPAPRWVDKIHEYGNSIKSLAGKLWPATPPSTDIKRKEEEQPLLHRKHEKQD